MQSETHAHLRTGLRGGRGRTFARRRLRSCLSRSRGRGPRRRAVFAHLAAGRHLGREYHFVRLVRRWRGRRAGAWRGRGARRPPDSRHAFGFYPNSEQGLGWDISEKGFKMVLARELPEIVEKHRPQGVDAFLAEHSLIAPISEVGCCIPAVRACSKPPPPRSALSEDDMAASWDCLRRRRQSFFRIRAGGTRRSDVETASVRREPMVCWPRWDRDFPPSWFC